MIMISDLGGIGRRMGLKILFSLESPSSILGGRTIFNLSSPEYRG
jgi:hypothetical protein